MRLLTALQVALAVPAIAAAQALTPITAMPLLPPSAQPPADQAQPAPPSASPPPPVWVPEGVAELQILDKVNAQNALLTVKVGQEVQYGSLTIQVAACDGRPRDQPQNSAAFLTITDSHADQPGFRGWMLANDPSVSMLQHPIYDVRIVACKTA